MSFAKTMISATPGRAPALSIVIPVYDEEESVGPLAAEIRRALADHEGGYEAIFVDDGSRDRSLEALQRLALEDPAVRVLRLGRNSGQSAALAAGFRAARAPIVVTLDADLQNDPADIPRVVAALEGHDLVSGIRARRRDDWVRRVSSRIGNAVRRRVVGDSITDIGCSLKAYRAHLLRDLPVFDGMHRFLPGLLQKRGARVVEVPVNHRPRIHGESKYNVNNRLWRGLADLVGVRWLERRWIDGGSVEELGARRPPSAATGGKETPPTSGDVPPNAAAG